MPKRENRGERNQGSNKVKQRQQRRPRLVVRVLPEGVARRVRFIDERHVRYYFTLSAWLNGVMTRKWIVELFREGSEGVMVWSDVPIRRDAIHVRSEEAVFILEDANSLEDVKEMVGGELVQPHQSVLVNEDWLHDYSAVHAELGVLVNGPDEKSQSERIQVSTRYKKNVEKRIRSRRRRRARSPCRTSPPVSPGDC